MPSHKTPRYCLYRTFVDAYMKGHPGMSRCVSKTIRIVEKFARLFLSVISYGSTK